MEKKLIKSVQEIIDLIEPFYSRTEDLEYDLGIEFAYESNRNAFRSDYSWFGSKRHEEDPYDGEEVTFKSWRKQVDSILPSSYPVLMVYYFENDFDYFGKVDFRFFTFVTLDDFRE